MLTWALVNVVLSGLALSFALVNKGAPHRLRFHVCFVALLAWLVPWSQVPAWMPDLLSLDLWRAEQRMIVSSAQATTFPLILVDTRSVPLAGEMTVLHLPLLVLSGLLLSGLGLFTWQVTSHHWRLSRLAKTAQDRTDLWQHAGINSAVPILLQTNISGAFSSGVLKPRIWVHTELTRTPQLPTLLRHELTHIQQHDNWYLLVITLVEKLFWWNPLVRLLGSQARHLQELSCDERCRESNADYAVHLAALMLADIGIPRSRASEQLLLSANIFNKPNLNIQRLKVLQRSHNMKPRHIVSSVATAVLAIVSVGLVTAQPDPGTAPSDFVIVNQNGTVTAEGGAVMKWEGHASFDSADPASVASPGESYSTAFGMRSVNGVDQFMKVERHNDETVVTFSFTDAALPVVLGPLADMLANPAPALALAGVPGQQIAIRRLDGPPPGMHATGAGGDVMFTAPVGAVQTFEFKAENGEVIHGTAAEPVQFAFVRAGAPDSSGFPISPNVVLEADNARERQVTVSGENMSLDDAISAIAAAANCNVFKDDKTIVVDWCGAQ